MRKLLINTITPLAWKHSEASVAKAAMSFSEIEADSGWQALQLLYQTDNTEIQAELFEIALEEAFHSALFRNLSPTIDSSVAINWRYKTRQSLMTDQVPIGEVLADIAVSEEAVYKEFESYARATNNKQLQVIFERISEDEAEHSSCASNLIDLVTQDSDESQRLLKDAKKRRFWRTYIAGSKSVGEFMMSIVLMATYIIAGVFTLPYRLATLLPQKK